MNSTIFNQFGKNILITGGNSGIGFYCVINLLKQKNYIYIPVRSISREKDFLAKLKIYFDMNFLNKYLNIIKEIDFSDLENIKKLSEYTTNKNIKFDILILNAGIQYTGSLYPKVSRQGIELTFAINHLAHFYLTNLFLPQMNDSSESRIIITSSDVHNPKSSGGNIGKKAGLNNLENFKEEIIGKYNNFNADKSYKNSKLCNILFAKELAKKIEKQKRKISIISWAPGLVIPNEDLGFFRYSSKFNQMGYYIFSFFAKNILGISEIVSEAGRILSKIAMSKDFNNVKYLHLSNQLIAYKKHKLSEANTSLEANDPKLAKRLWRLSEELCLSFGITLFDL